MRADPKLLPTIQATDRDYAKAAAWFDGEGSVIARTSSILGIARKGRPVVSLTQKDVWVCDWLRNRFGGSVKEYTNKLGRAYHYWRVTGKRSEDFLRRIFSDLSPRRQHQIIAAYQKCGYDFNPSYTPYGSTTYESDLPYDLIIAAIG